MNQARSSWPQPLTSIKALLILALTGLAGFQLLAAFPGYLSHDSAAQWWQARTGEITSLWPPGSVYLIYLFDRVWIGPHGVFVFQIIGFWLSATIIVATRGTWQQAVVSAVVFALMPIAWVCIAHVWSDIQLGVFLLLVTVMLLFAERSEVHARQRRWYIAAAVLLCVCTIFRHNAIVAALPLFVLIALRIPLRAGHVGMRRRAALGGGMVVCSLLFYGANVHFSATIKPSNTALTQIWDLQALSVARGQNLIPREVSPNMTLDALRNGFAKTNALAIYDQPNLQWLNISAMTAEERSALWHAWSGAIAAAPGAYLSHRYHVFKSMLGKKFDPVQQGGSDERIRLQLRDNPSYPLANPALLSVWQRWSDTLKASRWATAGGWILVASLVFGLRVAAKRRYLMRLALPLALWASMLLYLMSFFFTTPAADLRYVFWPVVASVLAAVLAWQMPCSTNESLKH